MELLTKPKPVRLTAGTDRELRKLSKDTNVSVSALIRLAVTAGIPALVSQFGNADAALPARKASRKGGVA